MDGACTTMCRVLFAGSCLRREKVSDSSSVSSNGSALRNSSFTTSLLRARVVSMDTYRRVKNVVQLKLKMPLTLRSSSRNASTLTKVFGFSFTITFFKSSTV